MEFAKNRVIWLDTLRVLATFGVIVLHVASTGYYSAQGYDWQVSAIFDCLVRWAVPVFVMISGALFLNPQKNVTIHGMVFHYIPRLLIAYFSWWIIYSFARAMVDTYHSGNFCFRISYLSPHFHLWFLPMLCGVYLLIPLLRRIIVNEKLVRYSLVLWALYIGVGNIFSLLEKNIPQISVLFETNLVLGYAGYFLLGYWLSIKTFSRVGKRIIYGMGTFAGIVTVFGTLNFNELARGGYFLNNLTINVGLMAVALFVFIKEYVNNPSERYCHFLNYIRKDLFGIYLCHAIWLMIIDREIVRSTFDMVIAIPLISVVVFVFSLYTTKLLRKIPLLRKIVE